MEKIFYKNKSFVSAVIIIFVTIVVIAIIRELQHSKMKQIELIETNLYQEAVAHFDNIVYTRRWNASHGAVYVKQHDGIQPNPYLKDNILHTDKNETLIKINPAWMTRQISEIANKAGRYRYNITALEPVNPYNVMNAFEKEALLYFSKHPDERYFVQTSKDLSNYNFMGNLKIEKACLKCHDYAQKDLGTSRGGISVSIPLENHQQSIHLVTSTTNLLIVLTLGIGVIVMLLLYVVHNFFKEQEAALAMNMYLESEVKKRTLELQNLNDNLEKRVSEEVEKNRKKDQMMLSQYRNSAMNEMAAMIAHQWRQPLSFISMKVNNMIVDIELENFDVSTLKKELYDIVEHTTELSNGIDLFRDYVSDESTHEKLHVKNMLKHSVEMLQNQLAEARIHVIIEYAQNLDEELCSKELIHILLTLLNNAKEALESCLYETKIIKITALSKADILEIVVEDNGEVIDETSLSYLFDPYYTTKENYNGAGMGLYVAKSIIEKELHGEIVIENAAVNMEGKEYNGVRAVIRIPKS